MTLEVLSNLNDAVIQAHDCRSLKAPRPIPYPYPGPRLIPSPEAPQEPATSAP